MSELKFPWDLDEMCECGWVFGTHEGYEPYKGLRDTNCRGFVVLGTHEANLNKFWRELNA